MKLEQAVLDKAAETAKSLGVNTLWVNHMNEMFTKEDLARISVGGDTAKLQKLNFETVAVAPEVAEAPIAETTIQHKVAQNTESKYAGMLLEALQEECKTRGITFSPAAKEKNLIGKLEADDAAKAKAANAEGGEPKMIDVEVTQQILDMNPELVEQGVKVGEIIQVPEKSEEPE